MHAEDAEVAECREVSQPLDSLPIPRGRMNSVRPWDRRRLARCLKRSPNCREPMGP